MIIKNEERNFITEDECFKFLEELEATIDGRWVQKNQILAGGIPDAPICAELIKDKIPFPSAGRTFEVKTDAETETLLECMGSTKLMLMLPGDGKERVRPISQYGLAACVQRAGYGSSPVLCNTTAKKGISEMPSSTKAMILNEAFKLYGGDDDDQNKATSNKVYVYELDGMIDYVGSNNYSYVSIEEANSAVRRELGNMFPDYSFEEGTISREYASFTYRLNDANLKKELETVFLKGGINIHGYEPMIRFGTSNVGVSGMNLYPVLKKGNHIIEIDLPIKLEHKNGANAEMLAENTRKILTMFRLTPSKIDALADLEIEYPELCMKNIVQSTGLPQKFFFEKAEDFGGAYADATALDLYFALSDALGEYKLKNKVSTFQEITYTEKICRIMFGHDLGQFDTPGSIKAKIVA